MDALFAATAFLGSFLLFTVELIAAKLLLPSFGGAAYVWTTSLMVFQGLLLAGYLYAHKVLERGKYGCLHFALLGLALLFFPISVSVTGTGAPIARLVLALLRAIGLPFLALSTTSTILQGWHARFGHRRDEAGTYALYAASNAGSLLALLAYPFLIEPFLTVAEQLTAWMVLYAVFVVLHWPLVPPAGRREHDQPSVTPLKEKLSWLFLALGPSAALLAATNLLTLDFAAVPLLWIVPLAVYLSTFILNFKKNPWYPRRLSMAVVFAMVVWIAAVIVTVKFSADLSDRWQLIRRLWVVNKFVFLNASLFILCLICHRSLARGRPRTADAPRYYALIALGGFLGSVLVAVIMPIAARRLAMPELDWALAGGLSLGALVYRDWIAPRAEEGTAASKPALAAVFLLGAAGLAFYVSQSPAFEKGTVYSLRNFYGYYRVVDDTKTGFRRFFHGNTMHGLQSLDPKLKDEPFSYFHRGSPIGEALTEFRGDFPRVGILGLGVGILAAYGEPGQSIDYYELDPDVARIAQTYFTFLKDTPAKITITTGDARLQLAQAPKTYDLIILDAFTGGAIPVHMLTREAFEMYESKLNQGGVIAVHITNRFLNLRPALAAMARDRGLLAAAKQTDLQKLMDEKYYSSWVILSRDPEKIGRLRALGWKDLSGERRVRVWTDGYASLLSALKS